MERSQLFSIHRGSESVLDDFTATARRTSRAQVLSRLLLAYAVCSLQQGLAADRCPFLHGVRTQGHGAERVPGPQS